MNVRYYAESDGGGHYESNRKTEQPRTFYVIDAIEGERIDCESMAAAKKLARKLNRENDIAGMRKMLNDPQT